MPDRAGEAAAALQALDEITRRLRRECPWDREQDERSIVPHTIEEAYELADAADAGDDQKLLDELGDVLFQVYFLALLLEERGAGDLAAVADHCREKLIRRHPHVFAGVPVSGSAEVLRNWDEIKRAEPELAGRTSEDAPEALPSTLYARKALRRAGHAGAGLDTGTALGRIRAEAERLHRALERRAEMGAVRGASGERAPRPDEDERSERFTAVGELLLAAVALAREVDVDPELALRAATKRFMADAGDE